MSLKLDVKDSDLDKLRKFILDEVTDIIFTKSQENIVQKKIVDRSTLLNSGRIDRGEDSNKIVYATPYADTIEFGRIPGKMPPVDPIKAWIRRKLKIKDEREVNSFAWAIAKDQKKNGTSPRPYLLPAIHATDNITI